jgi:hypothetical protein
MNYYPSSYLNAATAAAVAASTASLQVTSSDIERFQYLAQSPYFMQNNNILANMFKMFPKWANNMAFSNLVLKQNLASMSTSNLHVINELPSSLDQHQSFQQQNMISSDSIENSIKSKPNEEFNFKFQK